MSVHDVQTESEFTDTELRVLKLFYQGVRARQLRETYWWVDPWRVVAKHRALPRERHEAIRQSLEWIS